MAEVLEQATFISDSINRKISSQSNLPAQIEQVQDKFLHDPLHWLHIPWGDKITYILRLAHAYCQTSCGHQFRLALCIYTGPWYIHAFMPPLKCQCCFLTYLFYHIDITMMDFDLFELSTSGNIDTHQWHWHSIIINLF